MRTVLCGASDNRIKMWDMQTDAVVSIGEDFRYYLPDWAFGSNIVIDSENQYLVRDFHLYTFSSGRFDYVKSYPGALDEPNIIQITKDRRYIVVSDENGLTVFDF